MLLVDPAEHRKEKLVWALQGLLFLAAFIFSACWVAFLGLHTEENQTSKTTHSLPVVDGKHIGQAGFALAPQVKNTELMPLVQELVLLGKNTRPDSSLLSMVCLGLKSAGDKREVVCGQKLFLSQEGASFKFSDTPTDLVVTPLNMNRGVVLQIEKGSAKEEIALTPATIFQRPLDDEDYMLSLRTGKLWGPDMFLQQWGGDEYSSLSSKVKLELGGKVYFLTEGETLWWNGSEWKTGMPQVVEPPLVKLVSSSPQGAKVEVWDSTGYACSVVNIPLQQAPKQPAKQDEIMTAVRSRTPSEITCQLGKRRVTVKEGDWWVRTDGRWRPLKNTYDLEAFLHHEIQGELFIFEKIENGKERITLKGRSFDKMRTESQPLSLVFNTDKKIPAHPKRETTRASLFAKNKTAIAPVQHQNNDGEEQQ